MKMRVPITDRNGQHSHEWEKLYHVGLGIIRIRHVNKETLPDGMVAILNDKPKAVAAILAIEKYTHDMKDGENKMIGVVYRVADATESHMISVATGEQTREHMKHTFSTYEAKHANDRHSNPLVAACVTSRDI